MGDQQQERLWAPWRIGFIVGPKPAECFLCCSGAQEPGVDNLVLERGERAFCIMNRYPYTNGHLLISPYEHQGDLTEVDPLVLGEMMAMAQKWVARLRDVMRPNGFNMGFNLGAAAGAGVADHLHLHIVPRWCGDTNFMSVLSDARVINQSLEECYQVLASGTVLNGGCCSS